ncbi:MAG TPA: regulator [Verrucomicrobiae bacterium]|nr:regulator [Verrucomicrobiae bacterium]
MRCSTRIRWLPAIAALLFFVPAVAAQSPILYTKWENFTPANGMPDAKVFSVAIDGNRVWAGTENGLVLIENSKVAKVFTTADGLPNRVVTGIAIDKKTGDLWLATFGGLSQFTGGEFHNYSSMSSGLANDIVYGVAVQDEFLWAATTAGINRFNLRTGEWSIFSERTAPMHEPWSYSIAVGDGKVYVAVWGGGILEYDIAGGYWKPYTDPDGEMEIVLFKNQGLIHDIVSGVAYNHDTKMFWASTYFGMSGYDGHNWYNYLSTDSGLASDFINATQTRGDDVWACTDKGLSYLNFKTNTWVTYRPNKETGKGEILITTPDKKVTKLDTPTSLAHNYILNLAFQDDDIWVATAAGLSHGIPQSHKEGTRNEQARTSR